MSEKVHKLSLDGRGGVLILTDSWSAGSWIFSSLRESGDREDGEQDSEELLDSGSSPGETVQDQITTS